MIFWGVALFDVFGTDNLYYYKTIAYGISGALLAVTICLAYRRIFKEKDLTKQTPS
jgi:hypothetical protein